MSFLLCTCTKFGKNVTIKGRVLNPITGEGIPNIEIWLQKPTNGLPGGLKTIKKATTDENGNYEIDKFSLSANSAICALPASGEYYPIGWKNSETGENMGSPTLKIKKGKTMHVDFHALPYGDYQIKVKNVNCQGLNDTIIINQSNYVGSFLGINWILKGCVNYTTDISKVPMGDIYTKYTVIRNGLSTVTENVFTVVPNQLNLQEISY